MAQQGAEAADSYAGARGVIRPGRTKLAERLSRNIEDRILAEGWPVGHSLGREADQTKAAGVSRWTMREAISLLERGGLVETRRGGNGGLFVAANGFDIVRNGLSNFLEFVRPYPSELSTVRRTLETMAIQRAERLINDEDRAKLHAMIQRADRPMAPDVISASAEIREAILIWANHPALRLFIAALAQTFMHACWHSGLNDDDFLGVMEALAKATTRTAEALIDGKTERALDSENDFLALLEQVYVASPVSGSDENRSRALDRAYQIYPAIKPAKKAERISRQIQQRIVEAGWPVGMVLGSEADLTKRYGVGRAVLREAIRSLEQLGVVEMGRGGASGLKVISPNPRAMIAASQRYLRRAGLLESDRNEIRQALSSCPAQQGHGRLKSLFVEILDGCSSGAASTQ